MDPATALQTATAAMSVVELALKTYLFIRELANARTEARLLSQKTHRLYRLVSAVESRLHIREQLRGSKPAPSGEDEIEEIVRENFVAVRRGLLNINRKIRGLANDEELDLTVRVVRSFQFTLSAATIHNQEKAAETSIQTLSTALHLLQLLEHAGTQKRIEKLEKAVNRAVAHLESLPQSSQNLPVLPYTPSVTNSAEVSVDADLLGIQSLRKTIEVAKSVHSTCGSVSEPDKATVAGMEAVLSSDDSGVDDDEIDPNNPQIIEPDDRKLSTSSRPEIVLPIDDNVRGRYPPRVVSRQKRMFKEYATREIGRGNYATAEQYLKRAYDRGISLEECGYEAFKDKREVRQQLADIYIKQSQYGEAIKELRGLLQEVESAKTPEQILERAMLYKTLAHVYHSVYLSNKEQGHEDAAERSINLAEIYAIERSFTDLDELCESVNGLVTRKCSDFVQCVELIIQILDDQGKTVESEAWREEILSGPRTELDHPWVIVDTEKEQQLQTPGRTRLINAIIFDLDNHFQDILDESGGNIDEPCDRGLTPIMHAVACQHRRAIEKLVHHGADINRTTGPHNETALHQAAAAGNEQMVGLLLSKEANKDASAPYTPLLVAVKKNQNHIVDILLNQGADPNLLNADKWSMLHHAVNSNAFDTLVTLLSSRHKDKIDIEARSSTGGTALLLAAERATRPENYALAEALLRKHADPNATDSFGRSALYFATNGPRNDLREDFVRLLLNFGADPALTPSKFRTRFGQYIALRQANIELKRIDSGSTGVSGRSRGTVHRTSISSSTSTGSTSAMSTTGTRSTAETISSLKSGLSALGQKFRRKSGA